MMMEIWASIAGIDGYEVSTHGRVRSWRGAPAIRPRVLRPTAAKHGSYPQVGLSIYGRKNPVVKSVHRLVAQAFIPNPDNKPDVAHINGDPTDNRVQNLRWSTERENTRDRIGHGTWGFKLNDVQVREIRRLYSHGDISKRTLGKMYDVSDSAIGDIVNRVTWTHV